MHDPAAQGKAVLDVDVLVVTVTYSENSSPPFQVCAQAIKIPLPEIHTPDLAAQGKAVLDVNVLTIVRY